MTKCSTVYYVPTYSTFGRGSQPSIDCDPKVGSPGLSDWVTGGTENCQKKNKYQVQLVIFCDITQILIFAVPHASSSYGLKLFLHRKLIYGGWRGWWEGMQKCFYCTLLQLANKKKLLLLPAKRGNNWHLRVPV